MVVYDIEMKIFSLERIKFEKSFKLNDFRNCVIYELRILLSVGDFLPVITKENTISSVRSLLPAAVEVQPHHIFRIQFSSSRSTTFCQRSGALCLFL